MQEEGVQPAPLTLVGVLNACASVVALEEGRRTHDWVIKSGFRSRCEITCAIREQYLNLDSSPCGSSCSYIVYMS